MMHFLALCAAASGVLILAAIAVMFVMSVYEAFFAKDR